MATNRNADCDCRGVNAFEAIRQGDGPVRTSDRLRRRPKIYGRAYLYYTPTIIRNRKRKTKTRTAASRIAQMLAPGARPPRASSNNNNVDPTFDSTRKRRASVNLEDYTDSSGYEDEDIMRPAYRSSRNQIDNNVSQDELLSPKRKRIVEDKTTPRREGLAPRCSKVPVREQLNLEFEDEQETSEEKVGEDETENGNDIEDNDPDDGQNDGEAEDEGDGDGDDDGEEDGDDEECEEEQDGRRRYDLQIAEVRRLSMEEGKPRPRSPQECCIKEWGLRFLCKLSYNLRGIVMWSSWYWENIDCQGISLCCIKGWPESEFYMRKGADVLSKWVGEAERQLKLLLRKHKGTSLLSSFDEIDGLAPIFILVKWKHPPSKDLRLELAASCVGYCGADLKALCTEAAIRAFREKYPQVYTSDDKFLIDVDLVKVEKYHFVQAMSTITPAAHRGAVVHSRPLSLVVAPCLQSHLREAMNYISDIFRPLSVSSELTKLSMLSYGSAIPLVYRPRLLLCGGEGSGLKFPVHSLGLSSLLSDPSAKTAEEALVHIFGEARRTTPSILYLPQFNLWWETAHEQLRAVLMSLLEELPSDLPILLLGTSSEPLSEIDAMVSQFSLTVLFVLEGVTNKSQESTSVPELPKAPKVASGPKASELKAKVDAEQHALYHADVPQRYLQPILYDKRFSVFHYPVSDEDAPNYRSIIQNPMDMATLLHHVDSGQYITCSAFLQDVDLIVSNAKVYNGDDYNGARIVSRAFELQMQLAFPPQVHGMLSQMDPALVAYCDKIAAEGGPMQMPDDLGGPTFPSAPVVQLGTVTRNVDAAHTASITEEKLRHQDPVVLKTSLESEANEANPETLETPSADGPEHDTSGEVSDHTDGNGSHDVTMSDNEMTNQVESVKRQFVDRSENYNIPQLERLYTRVMKGIFGIKDGGMEDDPRASILKYLSNFAEDETNF
ncbi:hypothetical protein FNV43_RR02397 [Rhamnella rubrinervis]|uniref:Bromo domain-containing protein n=1 Tax=Rhamnella rubrinervis TaxID=2594499 RepID=A0A8K0HTK7_9ROSA|nr:hypothetical protein FNV43_RR02397 [Rhamnella rubrinervis]